MPKNEGGRESVFQTGSLDSFLISDYEYFQKAFELWANHFMGVFYLWTGTVVVPLSAGSLFTDLGVPGSSRSWVFALICIGVAMIAVFISLKMFDIRKAQLNNVAQMNLIRASAYDKLRITERYGLRPFGKKTDLGAIARRDFGVLMAIVMSIVNGLIFGVGATILSFRWMSWQYAIVIGIVLWVALGTFNCWKYFKIVVRKVPGKEIWSKTETL